MGQVVGKKGIELGIGCGVISLVFLRAHFERGLRREVLPQLVGIELQPSLLALASENAIANGFEANLQLRTMDLRQLFNGDLYGDLQGEFDFAFFNPPYYELGTGRLNQHPAKNLARHALHGGIADFMDSAAIALKPLGMVYFIYPFNQQLRLNEALQTAGFTLRYSRSVQASSDKEPELLLGAAQLHGSASLEILPPLIYRDREGLPTVEFQKIFYAEERLHAV
jgi:tRNA1(Val) A37 N6-methylase TrmN6